MKARIEFDRGKLVLHSDGPWQELTEYEFLHLFASCCDVGRALAMHKVYPPATDFTEVEFPPEPAIPLPQKFFGLFLSEFESVVKITLAAVHSAPVG